MECEGGVSVRWCPRCGTCTCPKDQSNAVEWVEDPACPIHGNRSDHDEPTLQPACINCGELAKPAKSAGFVTPLCDTCYAMAETHFAGGVCGEDHPIGDHPRDCFACLDYQRECIAAERDSLLEVARIEQALQMQGYTKATAKSLGPEAEDAYLCGGAPGLNNWRRQKREAAIARTEGGS